MGRRSGQLSTHLFISLTSISIPALTPTLIQRAKTSSILFIYIPLGHPSSQSLISTRIGYSLDNYFIRPIENYKFDRNRSVSRMEFNKIMKFSVPLVIDRLHGGFHFHFGLQSIRVSQLKHRKLDFMLYFMWWFIWLEYDLKTYAKLLYSQKMTQA